MLLEEFYQPVYHDFFFKWIVLNTKTYLNDCVTCRITEENDQLKTISFDIGQVHGEITIWFTNIIEEKIITKENGQMLFYIHYTIVDLAQCRTLFEEFYRSLLLHSHEKTYYIALCSNDGLSTAPFIDELEEVCEMNNFSIHLEAISLDDLKKDYEKYDVVYLAPQIAYAQPEILTLTKHHLPIHRLDPTAFATKDYQAIIDTIKANIELDKKNYS